MSISKYKRDKVTSNKIGDIIAILILTVYSEYFISVCIGTEANRTVFGESSLNSAPILFNSALILAPLKIIINTTIIFSVWRGIRPLIKTEPKN